MWCGRGCDSRVGVARLCSVNRDVTKDLSEWFRCVECTRV